MMMMMKKRYNLLLALIVFLAVIHLRSQWLNKSDSRRRAKDLDLQNFRTNPSGPRLRFSIDSLGKTGLEGTFAVSIPEYIGPPSGSCDSGSYSDHCVEYGDYGKFHYILPKDSNDYCARVEWTSKHARRLEDCFDLVDGVHWYGGAGPTFTQSWPIQKVSRQESPLVTGDFVATRSEETYGGVTENYWLLTSGVALHVDEDVPLHISVNSTRKNQICIIAEDKWPYRNKAGVRLKYDLCVGREGETFKDVHQRALAKFYKRPLAIPDERMLVEPIWSTWATYGGEVNQSAVLTMAHRIVKEGLSRSSHIEIDDIWEICYGDHAFGPKFPDPVGMTAKLRQLGFRSTVWMGPFVHMECKAFEEAADAGFLVHDERSYPALTRWWRGHKTGIIDFTKEKAFNWWVSRLEKFRRKHGIDGFKFGEI